MSPLALVVVAGALVGGGLLLALRAVVGSVPSLTSAAAELHRRRDPTIVGPRWRWLTALVAGRSSPRRAADLAVCARDELRWARDRLLWALIGAVPAAALAAFNAAGLDLVKDPLAIVIVAIVGMAAGFAWARADLASDADRARREFRHALASYLELVTILLAGGAGAETALIDGAAVGKGRAFDQLRDALVTAHARREPPWSELASLGRRLGISELEELEAAMTLAGGGALVRESLNAKAIAVRERDLAQVETEAEARSETMVFPVVVMFAGFLLMIGYPALAALSTV